MALFPACYRYQYLVPTRMPFFRRIEEAENPCHRPTVIRHSKHQHRPGPRSKSEDDCIILQTGDLASGCSSALLFDARHKLKLCRYRKEQQQVNKCRPPLVLALPSSPRPSENFASLNLNCERLRKRNHGIF